jgi:hypothetical protein
MEANENNAKLFYIDYGSFYSPSYFDMMELPSKFLYPCCSATCKVKLASGKPLSSLNFDKTVEKLEYTNEFAARVQKEGEKLVVTLKDSLVVYN